jgi:hypothetical protein
VNILSLVTGGDAMEDSGNKRPDNEQVNGKQRKRNPEEEEIEFRNFITKLLMAQAYEFLKEPDLFSSETLRRTMKKLCEIIAAEVKADSCTIHLKLYDSTKLLSPTKNKNGSKPLDEDMEKKLDGRIKKIAENWRLEKGVLEDEYRKILCSTLSFPYWRYPKGVARLIAANEGSPWESRVEGEGEFGRQAEQNKGRAGESGPLKGRDFVPLESGITSDIFQDNFAKIRDPLSIRSSRRLRKLGGVDHLVWRNKDWRGSFKNFYGSPIRIHPTGEVIGILKVENKHGRSTQDKDNNDDEIENQVIEILGMSVGDAMTVDETQSKEEPKLTEFEKKILSFAEEKLTEAETDYRKISLLALAYLSADLGNSETPGDLELKDLFFIPYPHGNSTPSDIDDKTKNQWENLKDCVKKQPIIQIMAKSIEEEQKLWEMLGPPNDMRQNYIRVKEFYKDMSDYFRGLHDRNWPNYRRWPNSLDSPNVKNGSITISRLTSWQGTTTPGDAFEDKKDKVVLSHFYFKAELKRVVEGKEPTVTLYIFAPPNATDIDNMDSGIFKSETESCGHADYLVRLYKKLSHLEPSDNPFVSPHRNIFWEEFEPHRSGEWISLQEKRDDRQPRHTHSVIDLLVDRWAARVEALNYCFPVREFSTDDTKKLCWAALEIGKLVEREISYRANHAAEPIPLTAMEFFRIPISDLCFVDDLQKRRADTRKVNVHIDYRIQNTLYTMHMQDAVRFKSRIKDNRSFLARLGERHEGFVRGNLAIWLYLLSLIKFEKKPADAVPATGKNEFDSFLDDLVKFRESIKTAIPEKLSDHFAPDVDGAFLEKNGDKLIGDTRFASPPLSEFAKFEENLAARIQELYLQEKVFNNLWNEGFVERAGDNDLKNDKIHCEITEEALENLIFRQYDPYAIAATSLLCQLNNLTEFGKDYLNFYERCFKLRNFLALSMREIEDTPELDRLADVFIEDPPERENWANLIKYVETQDTNQFLGFLKEKNESKLFLNAGGIYKRIRNLNHTLNHQRGLAHLEWELGRFDLLGCQLNCLYKNQVFAAYEQLWNSGDPFVGMVTKRPERSPVEEKEFLQIRLDDRQRWLCLRTKYFEDDYYSLQIAALVDPDAIHEGFWDKDKKGYNLRRVQYLLGLLFEAFDGEGDQKYIDLARSRQHLRWEYVDWYKNASDIVRTKSVPLRQDDAQMMGFGSFLSEAAIDFLMDRIDKHTDDSGQRVAKEVFKILQGPLVEILRYGRVYTTKILESLSALDKIPESSSASDEIRGLFLIKGNDELEVTKFYDATKLLYSELLDLLPTNEEQLRASPHHDLVKLMSMNDEQIKAWRQIVDKELDYYAKRFHSIDDPGESYIGSATPIIFVPERFEDKSDPDKRYEVKLDNINLGSDSTDIRTALKALYDVLERLRREQKRFLFYRDATDKTRKPGLSLRDKENVFYRIQNYVLLYNRSENDELMRSSRKRTGRDEAADPFLGWTSYGLFYYLRSLIPLEIQIRTMLADTLAEQYHDAIYKGAPPKGTEFPRRQMEKIAGQLDNLDKEMEIDFEDYINRRYFLKED